MKASIKKSLSIDKVIGFLIVILYANCLFDPAGLLLGLKNIVFILVLLVYFYKHIKIGEIVIPGGLLKFVILFSLLLPAFSIFVIIFFYFGKYNLVSLIFLTLKTQVFLVITLVFISIKQAHIKTLAVLMSILSVCIILLYHFSWTDYYGVLSEFGRTYRIFGIGTGSLFGKLQLRAYFWASPMLLFAISYYSYRVVKDDFRIGNLFFLILNITGAFLSGSRINMGVAIFGFFIVLFFYLNRRSRNAIITFMGIGIIVLGFIFRDKLGSFFGESDVTRNLMMKEYFGIYFSDIRHFLFGQGIGSEVYFQSRNKVMYSTELTYFELFRKFGFIMGVIYLVLMAYPIRYLFKVPLENRWIVVTYMIYCIMAFFNPFYFSSNGIIILSIVLFTIYSNTGSKKIVLKLRSK